MEQPPNTIVYEGSSLHYIVAGQGSMPLLLFHGFGQTHTAFESWKEPLGTGYRLFIFDLYFHGRSQWPEDRTLEKSDWKAVLALFLDREKIDRFAVGGYSLGGKFALTALELFPEKISHALLIAPDGIKIRFSYTMATYPHLGRAFFKSMVLYPNRFYAVARLFRSLGFLSNRVIRFAGSQMDTAEKRKRVYCSWVCFRHLRIRVPFIASLINRFNVPLTIIVGKYDQVIPAKAVEPLLRRVRKKEFVVLEAGHNDLIRNAVAYLTKNN
jgi:pimeloyl-ACP methyl ester carboxylesterase